MTKFHDLQHATHSPLQLSNTTWCNRSCNTDWVSLIWNAWDQMCFEFLFFLVVAVFECTTWNDGAQVWTQEFTFYLHLTHTAQISFRVVFNASVWRDIGSDVGFSTCSLKSMLKNFGTLVTFGFSGGNVCLVCVWSGSHRKWGVPEDGADAEPGLHTKG